jgi:hypothetical protein
VIILKEQNNIIYHRVYSRCSSANIYITLPYLSIQTQPIILKRRHSYVCNTQYNYLKVSIYYYRLPAANRIPNQTSASNSNVRQPGAELTSASEFTVSGVQVWILTAAGSRSSDYGMQSWRDYYPYKVIAYPRIGWLLK